MKVVLISRFPRIDTPEWKRLLGERLLRGGHDLAVLYSRSSLADHARAGVNQWGLGALGRYLRRGRDFAREESVATTTLARWAAERALPHYRAQRLDDAEAVAWTRSFGPDLLILVGADIVPREVLAVPRIGTINAHYGLLPRYRGMSVAEWSIYHDDPVGVSIHAVDRGIDTGDILIRETIPVRTGATLSSIRHEQQLTSARLLEEAVAALAEHRESRRTQRAEEGRQFYRMHPLLLERVQQHLVDGYRWLGVDDPPLDDGNHADPPAQGRPASRSVTG